MDIEEEANVDDDFDTFVSMNNNNNNDGNNNNNNDQMNNDDNNDEYHQKQQHQFSINNNNNNNGSSSSSELMNKHCSSSSITSKLITNTNGLLWNSMNNFIQMYRMRPKLCDVCLVTDDDCHIYAHRIVLATSMHYFSTMFIGQDYSIENDNDDDNNINDNDNDNNVDNKTKDSRMMLLHENIPSTSSSSTATTSSYYINFIEQNQYQILIKNIDGNSLNEIVKYCYLGNIIINETNVQMLLSAATMLNCKDIIKICCEFLRTKLQTTNAIGIYTFSEIIGLTKLKDFTFQFILNNFVQIIQHDEFLQLTPERIIEIIKSDYLDTGDEGEHIVLSAVINWIMFNYNERIQYLSHLIKHIRFPRFNQEELINIENEYPLVKIEPLSKDLLIEALKYHIMKNSCDINSLLSLSSSSSSSTTKSNSNELINDKNIATTTTASSNIEHYPLSWNNKHLSMNLLKNIPKVFDLNNARFRERISRSRQQCLIVIGGQAPKAICQCEYFDFQLNKWNEFICELPSRRCRSGIVVLNGLIYIIGGFNGSCRIRSVDMFDPKSNKWTQCASLEVKRSTLGACVLNGLIYAVGGFDGTLGLQSAEVYNPITRSWRFIAPMMTRRSSVAIVTLNGLLYAVGGYDGSSRQCLSSVECYNPETDSWQRIPDMSQRRSGASVEVLYSKIYAIGGHDGPAIRKSVECYDPKTNQWSQCADMIFARRNAVVIAKDGCLYVVGGEDGQTNLKSVEVYDPKTNSWSLLQSEMNIGRSYAGIAIIEKTWSS